jgi:SAM-dependent methyltransferase
MPRIDAKRRDSIRWTMTPRSPDHPGMSNEFKGLASHSAEWFGESRDHWWNVDYLRFLSAKWYVEKIRNVLDVGCGVGHWSRMLSRVLPDNTAVIGVDRDPIWVQKATERAAAAGLSSRFRYEVARAEQLPFDDDAFDFVTCQTVLMHLRDAALGLKEMIRVTRPGGLILAAEATNLTGPALLDAITMGEPPEFVASLLRFQLHCQRGKAALGEGNDLIGESLPALFASTGLREVQVRLNDRVNSFVPPYESAPARAFAEEALDSAGRGIWMWNRGDTLRYFAAGGGREEDFDNLWASVLAFQGRVAEAMSSGHYICAGGGLFYLVWGWKPARVV